MCADLPRETQYVPLYIAATKITMDPEAYGFTVPIEFSPTEFDVIKVKGSYDLPHRPGRGDLGG